MCQTSTNVIAPIQMLPTFVTCCLQRVSMIRDHITVIVYLASTVLLAARLAAVTTVKLHIV